MKVVHIITGLQQGGAEAMLEKLLLTSQRTTPWVEHEVVSLRDLGVVGPRLRSAGFNVTALGMNGFWSALFAIPSLARLLLSKPADVVVQTWLYHADLIGGLVARACGRRNVYWNLRVVVNRPDFGRLTFVVLRVCAALSGLVPLKVIACGPVVLASHVELGYSSSRGVVLGNGFDLARFQRMPVAREALRKHLAIDGETLVVGTVARLHPQKDFDTLARAAAIVSKERSQARFLWIGSGVDTDLALDALLQELGIRDRVIRLGLRKDVPELLNAMDIYCLPSRSEGFPNVLGEAMACALPCVSTDAGDAAYLLGSRDWVVPTETPAALASALNRLLQLPRAARLHIGAENRARVAAEFSIESAWANYLRLYGSTSTHRPRPTAA